MAPSRVTPSSSSAPSSAASRSEAKASTARRRAVDAWTHRVRSKERLSRPPARLCRASRLLLTVRRLAFARDEFVDAGGDAPRARRQSDFAGASDDAIGVVSTPYARTRRINRLYRIDPSSARSNRRRLSRISGLLSLKTPTRRTGNSYRRRETTRRWSSPSLPTPPTRAKCAKSTAGDEIRVS